MSNSVFIKTATSAAAAVGSVALLILAINWFGDVPPHKPAYNNLRVDIASMGGRLIPSDSNKCVMVRGQSEVTFPFFPPKNSHWFIIAIRLENQKVAQDQTFMRVEGNLITFSRQKTEDAARLFWILVKDSSRKNY